MNLIKIILTTSLVLWHFSASAQSIEVTLMDDSTLNCEGATSLPAACTDSAGTRFLVRADERSANGISLASDGTFDHMILLKQVKWDDQIIFEQTVFPGAGFPGEGFVGMGVPDLRTAQQMPEAPPQPRSTYRSDFMTYTSILGSLDYTGYGANDPKTLSLIADMRSEAQTKLDAVRDLANPSEIEIEFGEDQKSLCEKIKPRVELHGCLIYRCKEPKAGFYLDNNFGYSTMVSLDANQKIVAKHDVDRVWNPLNREKPVMESMSMNPYGGYGGMGMGIGMGGYGPSPQMEQEYARMQRQAQRQLPFLGRQQPQTLEGFSDPMYRSIVTSMADSCDEEAIAPITRAINGLRQQVADAQMVQLVEVTNNMLHSRLINPNAIPENTCRDGDTWYRGQSYDLSRDILANASPKTIDMQTATRLFNQARAMDDISWNYKADGCYARAHLMARRFETQGIHVDKVWIKGDLRVPEASIQWNFHVAPIVYVEDENGNVEKMVIDPSLMDGPVPVEQWSAKMEKGVVGETLETSYPFPENAANLERTAIAYSNSNPYLPSDQITLSEEDKMRMADETMVRYLGFSQ